MPIKGSGTGSAKAKPGQKKQGGTTKQPGKSGWKMPADPVLSTIKMPGKPDYGKMARQANKARKEGKDAAKGQLATISDRVERQVSKQGRKLDARSDRILRNMRRLENQQRAHNTSVQTGIQASAGRYAQAGGGKAHTAGMTGARSRSAAVDSQAQGMLAKAGRQQGKAVSKAAGAAVKSAATHERGQDRNTLSILDVLAAERKSTELHDVQMQKMAFKQDIYKMAYQQKLTQEYTAWQLENDLILTPEQQAAQDWKYQKKSQTLAYRLESGKAQREGNAAAFHSVDQQMDAVTEAAQATQEVISSPQERQRALNQYWNVPPGNREVSSKRDALKAYVVAKVGPNVPEGVEMSAVNQTVSTMFDRASDNNFSGPGSGAAPTWQEVSGWISGTSPEVRQYMSGDNKNLEAMHDNYTMIRRSMVPAPAPDGGPPPAEVDHPGLWDKISDVASGIIDASTGPGDFAPDLIPGGTEQESSGVGSVLNSAAAVTAVGIGGKWLASSGVVPKAIRAVSARFGHVNALNPMNAGVNEAGAIASEGGAAAPMLLADLGLIGAAGLVSYKLIDTAADAYVMAEGEESESLNATMNLLEAKTESIKSGFSKPEELQAIVDGELSQDASHLYSGAPGWTDHEKQMIKDRAAILLASLK